MTYEDTIAVLDGELQSLADRGYGTRERIMRKLAEELGEYAEAIEYKRGSTNKTRKFAGKATPEEKLREEACDLVMMSLAAARAEGINIIEACRIVAEKLQTKRGGGA